MIYFVLVLLAIIGIMLAYIFISSNAKEREYKKAIDEMNARFAVNKKPSDNKTQETIIKKAEDTINEISTRTDIDTMLDELNGRR